MIALAIVVFVFASVLMVESASIDALERTKRMNTVAMLAKQVMAEAEVEIEGKPFKEVDKEKGEAFKAPYEDYRWVREFKEMEFPDIMGGGGGGAGGEDGGDPGAAAQSAVAEQMGKVMTKFLSNAMRELSVTIYWKRGDGEQSYTVATWMVDLNGEFQINP